MRALLVSAGFVVAIFLFAWFWERGRAAPPRAGSVRRRAERLSARLFVDKPLPGGLRPARINPLRVHLLLSDDALLITNWRGALLSLRSPSAARVVCTGPRRLVIEGERRWRGETVRLRFEVLVEDAEGWARDIQEVVSPTTSAGTASAGRGGSPESGVG